MPIRVLIADDQAHARNSLAALLSTCPEIEIVGQAANGSEALHLHAVCRPGVVLMDARMPLMDGIEATRRIKAESPETAVLVLTMYGNLDRAATAAGADAVLVKGCPADQITATILRIAPPRGAVERT